MHNIYSIPSVGADFEEPVQYGAKSLPWETVNGWRKDHPCRWL